MPILEARGVRKLYQARGVTTRALEGVDLCVGEGEFTAIAGPSGSGKTTLLNVLGALDAPSEGQIFLDKVELTRCNAARLARIRLESLGFIFQAYNLIPVFSARENVEFVMELQGVPARERRARALEVLDQVGLGELGSKRPLEMSGGQQQRVAIARAIASRPRIVLADEPTANVDSATADGLLRLMSGLNREHGITFLFSTHDPRVLDSARRVIALRDGQVAADTAS